MDVLVYSALNEQAHLKKQVAAKQKELFDLKANSGSGGGSAGDAEACGNAWLADGHERFLQLCPNDSSKWANIYGGADWTGGFKVCDATGNWRCGQSCTWTVPSGITKARFQMWGAGGGANHPSRCCGWTHFGSTGAYLSVIIPVTAGSSYNLCGGCAYCCWAEPWSGANRRNGCPSYVTGPGLCYVCADGGDGSHGVYFGTRMGKSNPCYMPNANNAGSNEDHRTCYYGGSICRNSGHSGGFFDYVSGAGYFGTTNISVAQGLTGESVLYGLRGQWGRMCVHNNSYGCFYHPLVYGFETESNCDTGYSNTCCGGGFRASSGYMQFPGAGGWMSSAMGGCVSHCGDNGRMGMVCVSYQ